VKPDLTESKRLKKWERTERWSYAWDAHRAIYLTGRVRQVVGTLSEQSTVKIIESAKLPIAPHFCEKSPQVLAEYSEDDGTLERVTVVGSMRAGESVETWLKYNWVAGEQSIQGHGQLPDDCYVELIAPEEFAKRQAVQRLAMLPDDLLEFGLGDCIDESMGDDRHAAKINGALAKLKMLLDDPLMHAFCMKWHVKRIDAFNACFLEWCGLLRQIVDGPKRRREWRQKCRANASNIQYGLAASLSLDARIDVDLSHHKADVRGSALDRYIQARLQPMFEEIFGRQPGTTKDGPFVRFCVEFFRQVGFTVAPATVVAALKASPSKVIRGKRPTPGARQSARP
jgi:hypothetical protein